MNIFVWNTATSLAVVLSFVIPLLSALLAKGKVPANVAGALTMLIAAINGFVTSWVNSGHLNNYDWKTAAGVAIFSYLVAVASHYGLWKGTDTQNKALAVGNKAPATA